MANLFPVEKFSMKITHSISVDFARLNFISRFHCIDANQVEIGFVIIFSPFYSYQRTWCQIYYVSSHEVLDIVPFTTVPLHLDSIDREHIFFIDAINNNKIESTKH